MGLGLLPHELDPLPFLSQNSSSLDGNESLPPGLVAGEAGEPTVPVGICSSIEMEAVSL